jgi:hypothetical protein
MGFRENRFKNIILCAIVPIQEIGSHYNNAISCVVRNRTVTRCVSVRPSKFEYSTVFKVSKFLPEILSSTNSSSSQAGDVCWCCFGVVDRGRDCSRSSRSELSEWSGRVKILSAHLQLYQPRSLDSIDLILLACFCTTFSFSFHH